MCLILHAVLVRSAAEKMTTEGKFESCSKVAMPKKPSPSSVSAEDMPKSSLPQELICQKLTDLVFPLDSGPCRMWTTIHKRGCSQSCTTVFLSYAYTERLLNSYSKKLKATELFLFTLPSKFSFHWSELDIYHQMNITLLRDLKLLHSISYYLQNMKCNRFMRSAIHWLDLLYNSLYSSHSRQ